MGTGETEAGSILLVGCAAGAMIAPLSGRILDRWGAWPPVLVGAVLAFCGMALHAVLSAHLETLPATAIYVVFAFGQSLMAGNMLTTSLGFLPAATKADGNAVINTPQQLSGAIGTAAATAAPTPTGEARHDPEAGAKGLFAKRKVTPAAGPWWAPSGPISRKRPTGRPPAPSTWHTPSTWPRRSPSSPCWRCCTGSPTACRPAPRRTPQRAARSPTSSSAGCPGT